jgi:hypothetical protein
MIATKADGILTTIVVRMQVLIGQWPVETALMLIAYLEIFRMQAQPDAVMMRC